MFPWRPGLAYFARVDLDRLRALAGAGDGPGGALTDVYTSPVGEAGPPPRVEAVFPSADEWPENTLRVYVHFSAPMRRKEVHRHVRLLDAEGRDVPVSFVEIENGLWDPDGRRLTLFLHPGRIKRGVGPNAALGPPLRAGERYSLVIDAAMSDDAGRPLEIPFAKTFQVVGADRVQPDAAGLRIRPPGAPEAPLVLELGEPLDRALLLRLVAVEGKSGERVEGHSSVADGETIWTFRADRPWVPGAYALRISSSIEDRAGNSFERLFDQPEPASTGAESPERATSIVLPFEVDFVRPAMRDTDRR